MEASINLTSFGNLINHTSLSISEQTLEEINNFCIISHIYKKSFKDAFTLFLKISRIYTAHIVFALLIFLSCVLVQGFAIIYSDSFYTPGEKPLLDRIHSLFEGPVLWAKTYVNLAIMIFGLVTFFRFALFSPLRLGCLMLIRFFWILSILYNIRAISFIVTTLPTPVYCVPANVKNFSESLQVIFEILIGKHYECTDLIISGHTLFTTILLMFWVYYSRKSILSLAYAFTSAIIIYTMIIISFYHYTIDVLMGICFGFTTFFIYHLLVDIGAYQYKAKKNPTNYLANQSFEAMTMRRHPILTSLSKFVALIEGMDFYMNYQTMQECYYLYKDKFSESFIPPIPNSKLISLLSCNSWKSNRSNEDCELFNLLAQKHIILRTNFDVIYFSSGGFGGCIF